MTTLTTRPVAMTNEVDVSTIKDGDLFTVDGRPPMVMRRRGDTLLHTGVNPMNPEGAGIAFASGCRALPYKGDANRVTVLLQRSLGLRDAMRATLQEGLFIAYLNLQDHRATPQQAALEAVTQAMALDSTCAPQYGVGPWDYLPLALFEEHPTGIVWARDMPRSSQGARP